MDSTSPALPSPEITPAPESLIGIADWVNTRTSYIYDGTAGSPVLRVHFAFDSSAYVEKPEQAQPDLALYETILSQLSPGMEAAVAVTLHNSLLQTPLLALEDAQAEAIREWVIGCLLYLTAVVNSEPIPPPEPVQIAFPISVADLNADNISPLKVALILSRDNEKAESVSSRIRPLAGGGDAPDFRTFTATMETAFATSDWNVKVGLATADNAAHQLWAIRFGTAADKGIFFQLAEGEPSSYAPAPIAKSLSDSTASIVDYATGNPTQLTFRGVDQNLWFRGALEAIDDFLSGPNAAATLILDLLNGTSAPLNGGLLPKIQAAKATLARSIGHTATQILASGRIDAASVQAAQNELRGRAMDRLAETWSGSTGIVYPMATVSGATPLPAEGDLALVGPVGPAPRGTALSSATLPLVSNIADQAPCLTFSITATEPSSAAWVPISPTWNITGLDYGARRITFLSGPISVDLSGGKTSNIPVPLRTLPSAPQLVQQAADPSPAGSIQPLDLTRWAYGFDCQLLLADQDSVVTTVQLNAPQRSQTGIGSAAPDPTLFNALAQFASAYPQIEADFTNVLRTLAPDTADPKLIAGANKAVDAFRKSVENLATAFGRPQPSMTQVQPPPAQLAFESYFLPGPEGVAQTDIFNLEIQGQPASWNAATAMISSTAGTFQAPVIAIDPAMYTTVVPEGATTLSYVYEKTGAKPPELLLYSGPDSAGPLRTINIPGLNALLDQSALATATVISNQYLSPDEVSTSSAFLLTSSSVAPAEPVVPLVVHERFPLQQSGGAVDELGKALDAFFANLFTGGNAALSIQVSMKVAWSYEVTPGTRVQLPVLLMPPTETPLDPAVPPAFDQMVAQGVAVWFQQNDPSLSGKPELTLELTLAPVGKSSPLLQVQDLYYPITNLK